MKRVKDSGDRICLYGVYTEDYPELNYIEDGIKHSFSDDDTIVDWVVEEMEKNRDITKNYYADDEPTYMRKKVSPDGRFTMYYDGKGTIEIWCDEFAYRHGMSVYDSRRIRDAKTKRGEHQVGNSNLIFCGVKKNLKGNAVFMFRFDDGGQSFSLPAPNDHLYAHGNADHFIESEVETHFDSVKDMDNFFIDYVQKHGSERQKNNLMIYKNRKFADSRRVKDSFDFPEFDDLIKKYGRDEEFLYRLLSRMQTDCEYYLVNGGRHDAHLWALNPDKQIKYMIAIWDYLPEKPEWLSLDQLEEYSVEMTGKTLSDFGYNNTISDSRRIKDSVKAKSVRKRINDAIDKYFRKDLKNLQAYRRVTDAEGKIKEDVVFLIEDGDVLAVFPNTYGTADRDKDTMECYAHVGQHSTCTYDYANTLKTASKAEYADLYDELTNHVGYKLNVLEKLPSENELKQNGKEIRDSYIKHKRYAITDERMLARGEEIQYKGKRGTVQYALFHGQEPVVIRWTNEDGSEEFEIPYNEVSTLKIHDSEDDDANIETVDNDSEIDENEVTDGCGGKKKGKGKKKTADGVKCVKITKRQTKKTE